MAIPPSLLLFIHQFVPDSCDPMGWTVASGSSVHGILQARIPEWVAIPFSRNLPDPGIEPESPALQADSSPSEPSEKPQSIPEIH